MSTALVSIEDQIKADLALVKSTLAPPSGNSINLKDKVFTLPDGRSTKDPIRVVILDHRNLNRWFKGAYDPMNLKPPNCFAMSKDFDSLAPNEGATDPQADDCASCALNEWGSAPTGKGKACRNTVRLAVAAADLTKGDRPMLLTVSPTGIKSWNALVTSLATNGMLPVQVFTKVSFDQNKPYPTLVMEIEGPHNQLDEYWALKEEAQAMLDTPPAGD